MPTVIGYARVSTGKQGESGLGMEAQGNAIRYEANRRGWEVERIAEEVVSTRKPQVALEGLLDELDARGDGFVLMVAKIDRLGRSMLTTAPILARAAGATWSLVILEPNVDTTSPYGKAMAHMALVFAELERDLISQRTKEGLAVAMARPGYRHGTPRRITQEVADLIVELRDSGMSWGKVARRLEQDGHRALTTWRADNLGRAYRAELVRRGRALKRSRAKG